MIIKSLITFDCLHSAVFPSPAPRQGEIVFCTRCDSSRKVITPTNDYRWVCNTCGAARNYGRAFVTMETRATGHALRKVGHNVTLYDGGLRLRDIHHEPIPLDSGIPF